MPRRVQQRHGHFPQWHDRLLGKNRDAPRTFEAVVVKKAVPMIHPTQLFQFSGKVQHGLGQGGLARVHMGKYAQYNIVITHTVILSSAVGIINGNRPARRYVLNIFLVLRNLIYITCNRYAKYFYFFETLTIISVKGML